MLLSPRSLLFLLLGVSWCRGVDITAVTGSDVTFTTDVSERPSEITWYINNDIIVELMTGSPPGIFRWKDRVSADLQNGKFILKAVTPDDSGRYRAERLVFGKISEETFILKVHDRVCPVVIHNTTVENNVTLRCTCSNQDAPPSKYKWATNITDVVSNDQNITVQKAKKPQLYQCEASNAVSSSNFTVIVPALEDPWRSRSRGEVAAIIVPIIIIIIIIILAVLNKNKIYSVLRRCRGNKDEEKPEAPKEGEHQKDAQLPITNKGDPEEAMSLLLPGNKDEKKPEAPKEGEHQKDAQLPNSGSVCTGEILFTYPNTSSSERRSTECI